MNVYEYTGRIAASVDTYARFCRSQNCAAYVEEYNGVTLLVTNYPVTRSEFAWVYSK